jgi:3D (Asp-Asp-Asp) domain-containing protein
LNDNGYVVQIQTTDKTVKELLDKYEITLGPGDEIIPAPEESIVEGTEIKIDRAFKVTVAADGNKRTVYLTKGTIKDALDKAYIVLGEKDFTNLAVNRQAAPGDYITVTRVKEETLIEKENIPYKVVTKENNKLKKGTEKVVQKGKEGIKEREILIAYHNGVEVSREVVEERIAQEPMDRIIDKGTYVEPPPTSRGSITRDKKVSSKSSSSKTTSNTTSTKTSNKATNSKESKTFIATAYTHTGNRTRTGVWPKEGMIAVDPKVIPLHTRVYVEFPKGWTHLNGYYKAMDTGGAIKGNIIDVFMENEDTVLKFGRRKVKITY